MNNWTYIDPHRSDSLDEGVSLQSLPPSVSLTAGLRGSHLPVEENYTVDPSALTFFQNSSGSIQTRYQMLANRTRLPNYCPQEFQQPNSGSSSLNLGGQGHQSKETASIGDTEFLAPNLAPSCGGFGDPFDLSIGPPITYAHRDPQDSMLDYPPTLPLPYSQAPRHALPHEPGPSDDHRSFDDPMDLTDPDPSETQSLHSEGSGEGSEEVPSVSNRKEPAFTECAIEWLNKSEDHGNQTDLLRGWKNVNVNSRKRRKRYRWHGPAAGSKESIVKYQLAECKFCELLFISIPKNAQRKGTEIAGARGHVCRGCHLRDRKTQHQRREQSRVTSTM